MRGRLFASQTNIQNALVTCGVINYTTQKTKHLIEILDAY